MLSLLLVVPLVVAAISHAVPRDHAHSFRRDLPADLQQMKQRRVPLILASAKNVSSIASWLSSLGSDGKWPDSEVDYTTGCAAQRANWPAENHWIRILTMSAAWLGPLPEASQFQNDPKTLSAISSAMDWWFQRDFTNIGCLGGGGTNACPCGTSGLWNTNWFSNLDLIPSLVAANCVLLSNVLTSSQSEACSRISLRSYAAFDQSFPGVPSLTGANALDIASIGIDLGLFNGNKSIITDASSRVAKELVIQNTIQADGIHPDGSFSQHAGLMYNGNYGKDFMNDVLKIELVAADSSSQAPDAGKDAFDVLVDGSRWMIYTNTRTQVEHWDFSALPRFLGFPVIDGQATASINFDVNQLNTLAQSWKSDKLSAAYNQLVQNSSNANTGALMGNRAFWNNDYMVHRGSNSIFTVKGYSKRTLNTECTNSQNALGFHLADGAVYTHVDGDEYEDIAAAWDWNLIPGITVDYGGTPLNCDTAKVSGVETFVGGASNGEAGVFVMRYTNPTTKSLSWQKSWMFFEDAVQHVTISNIKSQTGAPVFTVLDQKKHKGDVLVDGQPADSGNLTSFGTLWHNNVGYVFPAAENGAVELSISLAERSGTWSTIGTSMQPPVMVDMFTASLHHKSLDSSVSYTSFAGVSQSDFEDVSKQNRILTLRNDPAISAAFDTQNKVAIIVFWDSAGGEVIMDTPEVQFGVSADHGAVVVISQNDNTITVADPTQTLSEINISVSSRSWMFPFRLQGGGSSTMSFSMPSGNLAGSSVTKSL